MTTPSKRNLGGRPRTLPPGTVLWAKRLTPAEITAVEAMVKRMRKRGR